MPVPMDAKVKAMLMLRVKKRLYAKTTVKINQPNKT
jgi:hypothetical protein